ncbi:MAG TPA: hypothetical protein V6D37_10490 [Candidatus Sericytochromatia bacterium]
MPGTKGMGLGIGEPIIWVVGSGCPMTTMGLASTEIEADITEVTPIKEAIALVSRNGFMEGC